VPIYEYRCENGHTFEVMQRMADDPVAVCTTCDAPVRRVLHSPAVHFKGSGFYNTDYGTKNRQRELKASAESGADKHDSKMKSEKSDGKSDSKSDSTKSSGDGGSSSTTKTKSESKKSKD